MKKVVLELHVWGYCLIKTERITEREAQRRSDNWRTVYGKRAEIKTV